MPITFTPQQMEALNARFAPARKRNPIAAGISSGIDALQGLGYNAAAAVTDAVGLNRARDWLLDRAAMNADEAYASGRPDLERIEDQDLSTILPYAGYQIAKQVPQIGAALGIGALTGGAGLAPAAVARGAAALPTAIGGGGLRAGADFAARRAALQAGQRFSQNLMGGAAVGTAMGAGSLYGESVEAGDPSPYAALAAAPVYGLTEGVPTALLGNTLARGAFRGALPTRMAKAAGVNALTGATSELLQNEMEMGFNPTLDAEEIASRRLNAAVAGGLAEGAFGSLGGLRRPPPPRNLLPGANPNRGEEPPPDEVLAPQAPQGFPRLDAAAPVGAQGALFEGAPAAPFMPAAAPAEDYESLMRDAAELQRMASEARLFRDPVGAQQIEAALAQVYERLNAVAPDGQRQFWPGVYEMVGDRPVELTGTQALQGGLPTLEGEREQAPQPDPRRREMLAVLGRANQGPGRLPPKRFGQFADRFFSLLETPQQLDEFLQTANAPLALVETAARLSEQRQQQMVDFGRAFAPPGARVGQAPVSDATEQQMRERNLQQAIEEETVAARGVERLRQESELESANARVLGAQQRQTAERRRAVLESALEGAESPNNARNRFTKRLRREGLPGGISPDEQQTIQRYFSARDTFVDEARSTANEMDPNLVPERREGEKPRAPRTRREPSGNRGFALTPPPSTEADLEAIARAEEKRARTGKREAPEAEAEPEQEGAPRGQKILFTKKGEAAADADQTVATFQSTVDGEKVEMQIPVRYRKDFVKEIALYKQLIDCLSGKR